MDIWLSEKQLDRLLVIEQTLKRAITQKQAAEQLGLSHRQVGRLVQQIRTHGRQGIKGVPKGGNRSFPGAFKEQVMELVRAHYKDFGPRLASQMLEERNGLKINKETLRQWMMQEGLWRSKSRKHVRIHQSRERRERFGELIQIDGSHHDWFEGRSPKCCLLVFVDDATGKLVGMRFDKSETTLGYMALVYEHITTYGRPIAYYSDRHSIFKSPKELCIDGRRQDTQLGRALRSLNITQIYAQTSQAKGRVERMNKTLQDRLIKQMRLDGINTIEEGNTYLPQFMDKFNKQFSVEAKQAEDAHRPLCHERDALKRILSIQTQRKLSKNLECSFENTLYQIETKTSVHRLRYKQVTICQYFDGRQDILFGQEVLMYKCLPMTRLVHVVDSKHVNQLVDDLIKQEQEKTNLVILPTGYTTPAQLSF